EEVPESERSAVSEVLAEVQRQYKQRQAQMHSLEAAAILRGEASSADLVRTIDFVPGRPRDPGATVDPAGEVIPSHVGSDPASAADTANAVGDPTMGAAE